MGTERTFTHSLSSLYRVKRVLRDFRKEIGFFENLVIEKIQKVEAEKRSRIESDLPQALF